MWHSCRRFPIRDVLRGVPAEHRAIYTRLKAMLRACGPVIAYGRPPHTIVFQARVRFGGLHFRKHWVEAALWLERKAAHRHLHHRVPFQAIGSHGYAHYFRFTDVAQVDRTFSAIVCKAYEVGAQRSRIKGVRTLPLAGTP
jgi:hypothetical protein